MPDLLSDDFNTMGNFLPEKVDFLGNILRLVENPDGMGNNNVRFIFNAPKFIKISWLTCFEMIAIPRVILYPKKLIC